MTIRELIYELLRQEDIDTEVEVVEENNIISQKGYVTNYIKDVRINCIDAFDYDRVFLVIRSDK